MNQQPFPPPQITFTFGSVFPPVSTGVVFQQESPFYDILALISLMSHPAPKNFTFPKCIFPAKFVCHILQG